jgi:1-deoxy-D-xylulose-5-phosphate reductoisomerase
VIGVAVLGSTGSIGESTLDVVARHPDRFRLVAIGARRSAAKLAAQIARYRPAYAALAEETAAAELRGLLGNSAPQTRILVGEGALTEIAAMPEVDSVMAAIVGAAGLPSTLAAARAGKRLLLANKESLVMAGPLLMDAVRAGGAVLLPIDSEHNAIFQCMPHNLQVGTAPKGVRRVLLTASGGPFRDWTREAIATATPEQACAHPNWVMGRKISVDSATLMNKGLELIEACLLFGLPPQQVEVVVHPQSIVHSAVEYQDGSVLAQLGSPDMRTPIAHALAWPDRISSGVEFLDLVRTARLDFRAPDPDKFRCLALAQAAARAGGLAPAVLNAANEVAVQAFLDRQLNFLEIAAVIESVVARSSDGVVGSLEDVLAADSESRQRAHERIFGGRAGAFLPGAAQDAIEGESARGAHA